MTIERTNQQSTSSWFHPRSCGRLPLAQLLFKMLNELTKMSVTGRDVAFRESPRYPHSLTDSSKAMSIASKTVQ